MPSSIHRWLTVALACAAVSACDPAPSDPYCSDPVVAEACSDTFCGAPTVRIGGSATRFEALAPEEEVSIWFGPQGSYHVEASALMENLCVQVYLRAQVFQRVGDSLELVVEEQRFRGAERMDEEGSEQFVGAVRVLLPCGHWPDDPDRSPSCSGGAGTDGPIEQLDVVIGLEVEDLDGRRASALIDVTPVCCAVVD